MKSKLRNVFQQVFGIEDIDDNAALGKLKQWDSFGHVNLMAHIEKEFSVKISIAKSQELRNVKEILKFLE